MSYVFLLILLAFFPRFADASDDNLLISNLYDESNPDNYWNVSSSVDRQTLFTELSRELAFVISHKNVVSGDTLGIYGFEVGFDSTVAFVTPSSLCNISTSPTSACQHQLDLEDPWRVMDADHRLTLGNGFILPTLRIRKGLPFSTETGADLSYIGYSHQSALSWWGRMALTEGFGAGYMRIVPDISLSIAQSWFLGNEELRLRVGEFKGTVGWTVPVAGIRDSYVGTFSPFFSLGLMAITAVPRDPLPEKLSELHGVTGTSKAIVTEEESENWNIRQVEFDQSFRPVKLNVGMLVQSGVFRFISVLEITTQFRNPTITVGVGFNY